MQNMLKFALILIIQQKFKYAIESSAAFKKEKEIIEKLCTAVLDDVYNLSNRRKQLGLEEQVREIYCLPNYIYYLRITICVRQGKTN